MTFVVAAQSQDDLDVKPEEIISTAGLIFRDLP